MLLEDKISDGTKKKGSPCLTPASQGINRFKKKNQGETCLRHRKQAGLKRALNIFN